MIKFIIYIYYKYIMYMSLKDRRLRFEIIKRTSHTSILSLSTTSKKSNWNLVSSDQILMREKLWEKFDWLFRNLELKNKER